MSRRGTPLVTLVDDALPTGEFRALVRAVRRLGHERIRAGYQTTFWFDFASQPEPTSLVERAVLRLREHVPTRGVAGVEWWLSRMRTSNVKVDFHRDRDNAYAAQTGRARHPRWSTLLYLNRCRGGLLAVTRSAPEEKNPTRRPDDTTSTSSNRRRTASAGSTAG